MLAYNLGNFMRRLTLPESVKHWSLRSVQTKLIKMGGRLVRHARRLVFQLAEVAVSREVFRQVWSVSPAPSSTRVAIILEVIRGEERQPRARCVPGGV